MTSPILPTSPSMSRRPSTTGISPLTREQLQAIEDCFKQNGGNPLDGDLLGRTTPIVLNPDSPDKQRFFSFRRPGTSPDETGESPLLVFSPVSGKRLSEEEKPAGGFKTTRQIEILCPPDEDDRETPFILAKNKEPMTPEMQESFRSEIAMMTQLQGLPGIVDFRGASSYVSTKGNSRTAIVMRRYEKGDLHSVLSSGSLSLAEHRKIQLDVLTGLVNIHQKGIVHRDIKLKNIFIGAGNKAVIGDFGMAVNPIQNKEKCKTIAGTLLYLAPEYRGRISEATTPAVDVYSMGLVFWIMHHKLHGSTLSPAQIKADATQDFSERKPGSFEDLVLTKMLSRDPERRITAAQALEELKTIIHFETEAAKPPAPQRPQKVKASSCC